MAQREEPSKDSMIDVNHWMMAANHWINGTMGM